MAARHLKLNWTTYGRGNLDIAGVHDACLQEFSYRHGTFLRFSLLGAGGQETEFVLNGVSDLNLRELWEGTIVSDICVWSVGTVPETAWDYTDSGWRALLIGRASTPEKLNREVQSIVARRPNALLVSVESSYGGNWSVVCDELQIWQR